MKLLPTEQCQLLEDCQPFTPAKAPDGTTGDVIHPLALLRDLNNDDKHKVITPLVTWITEISIDPTTLGRETAVYELSPDPLEGNARIMRIRAPHAEQHVSEADVGVLKSKLTLAGGLDPIETLDVIAEAVMQGIERLAGFT